MDPPASSPSMSLATSTLACIRCSERKVKCNKQNPCNTCVRHNAQCIFRTPKPSRKKRKLVGGELMEERLERYEALLKENGIDPDRITATSETAHLCSTSLEVQETIYQSPVPTSIVSEPQATLFKPRILRGQRGTKLVDK